MPVEKLTPSFTFTEERLQALQAVVPEAFADGRVNWETLKAALEPFLEDEGPGTEHFGLFWPGKRQARRLAAQPSKGTLRPVPGQGINEDTTRNLFIEGDNLEVLKLLQKSYAGRVKLIYIDPPYNTGNDFVYKDDFVEPLGEYLERTGQADAEGLLTTNPKSGGRFHSNWLNMMLPRLMLARTLLSEDGVIFTSIDDNEAHNLRQVMNEVFGEENFIVQIIWKKRSTPPNDQIIGANHEYIIIYAKKLDNAGLNLKERTQEQSDKYKNPDNHPKGPWTPGDLMANVKGGRYVESLYFSINNPNTGQDHYPSSNGNWRFNKQKVDELIKKQEIYFGENGKGRPKLKRFLCDVKQGITYATIWDFVPLNTKGSSEIAEILGNMNYFDNPKPVGLINELIKLGTEKSSIIVDFFSGSCSTANAILELNREDGGNRHFVMVQIPEPTPKESATRQAGYATIADIGKERIRRVIAKLQKRPVLDRDPPEDLGFAVYKLDRSHFKAWQDYDGTDPAQLEDLFSRFEDPLLPGWHPRALLDEILLLQGFPLDSRRTRLNDFTHNALIQVECDWFSVRLFICLDPTLNPATIDALPINADDKFICLDSALIDQTKQQLADRCTLVVL